MSAERLSDERLAELAWVRDNGVGTLGRDAIAELLAENAALRQIEEAARRWADEVGHCWSDADDDEPEKVLLDALVRAALPEAPQDQT